MASGGARPRNLGGGHLRGNTHFGGATRILERQHAFLGGKIAKIFDPRGFFPYIFFRNFFPDISNFFQTFQNCPDLPKFFPDLLKCIFFSNIS